MNVHMNVAILDLRQRQLGSYQWWCQRVGPFDALSLAQGIRRAFS
jgi:hypothetical protein